MLEEKLEELTEYSQQYFSIIKEYKQICLQLSNITVKDGLFLNYAPSNLDFAEDFMDEDVVRIISLKQTLKERIKLMSKNRKGLIAECKLLQATKHQIALATKGREY